MIIRPGRPTESAVFMAEYFGRCLACGDNIEPGEDVLFVDDELIHARDDLRRSGDDAP